LGSIESAQASALSRQMVLEFEQSDLR